MGRIAEFWNGFTDRATAVVAGGAFTGATALATGLVDSNLLGASFLDATAASVMSIPLALNVSKAVTESKLNLFGFVPSTLSLAAPVALSYLTHQDNPIVALGSYGLAYTLIEGAHFLRKVSPRRSSPQK